MVAEGPPGDFVAMGVAPNAFPTPLVYSERSKTSDSHARNVTMMLRSASLLTLIVLTLDFFSARAAQTAEPLLRAGDRLALVGGTFVERMQAYPWLEAELQIRQPD